MALSTMFRILELVVVAACALSSTVHAASNGSNALPNGKYEIQSEGIRAQFVPYAASISNLFIMDVHGVERDIVLGFDNASYYSISQLHPHLNGVPGRYANRIENSTFSIDGETFHTDANDHGGLDTLHGGSDGWDYRNWTLVAHTSDSITVWKGMMSVVDASHSHSASSLLSIQMAKKGSPARWLPM